LILMGDWCAVSQPDFENQVRRRLQARDCSKEKAGATAEFYSPLLTGEANG